MVPFGLKNAPSFFHRMMDRVLAGLPFARCYIDDVVVKLTESIFSIWKSSSTESRLWTHSTSWQVPIGGSKNWLPRAQSNSLCLFSHYSKFVLLFDHIATPLDMLLKVIPGGSGNHKRKQPCNSSKQLSVQNQYYVCVCVGVYVCVCLECPHSPYVLAHNFC